MEERKKDVRIEVRRRNRQKVGKYNVDVEKEIKKKALNLNNHGKNSSF